MKLRRILPLILAAALVLSLIPAVVIGAQKSTIAVGTTWRPTEIVPGVSAKSGPFEAFGLYEGVLRPLRNDGAGNRSRGTDPIVFSVLYQPESGRVDTDLKIVFGPQIDVENPDKHYELQNALVFTAPVAGNYSLSSIFVKYNPNDSDAKRMLNISVYKNGTGEALSTATSTTANDVVNEEIKNTVNSVNLDEGDQLWIVLSRHTGDFYSDISGYNAQAKDVVVTYLGEATEPEPEPEYEIGTVFSPVALGNNKLSDDNFALTAFKNGAKVALFETPDLYEWAAREGDKYKYYILDGEEKQYVVRGPESPTSDYKFMFTPEKTVGAAVIFTAPVSGTYSLDALFNKAFAINNENLMTTVTIAVYKNGTGAALASVTSSADPETAQSDEVLELALSAVPLNAGDELYVVCVAADEGYSEWGPSSNTEVDKFNITLISNEVSAPEYEIGAVFSPVALGNNKLSDTNFALAAFKDGAKVALFETPDLYEWAAREGDKYKYYILDGGEKQYVVRGPESPTSDYKFMFTPEKTVGAAVIFTAPVSGTYSLDALFNKAFAFNEYDKLMTTVTIAVYKNGTGAALASVTSSADPETAQSDEVLELALSAVSLNAGETLYVVCVAADEGYSEWGPSSNTEVDKFNITLISNEVSAPCDHEGLWEDGVCSNCGAECDHANAPAATCKNASVCPVCNATVAPVNPDNHTGEANVYVNNENGTHTVKYSCCGAVKETVDCVYGDDYVCDKCEYDNTLNVLAKNANDMINDYFANGNTITGTDYIAAVGPAAGALDSFATVQNGTADGFTYAFFNLVFIDGKVALRHHFIITGDVTVTLNGAAVELKNDECPANVFYFDVELDVGEFDDAQVIAAGEAEITVSLYSYIKVALEEGVTPDQETILRALYDVNEAA